MNIPKAKLELYNKLIATIPEIERKGKACPYTSYNGNMFSSLSSTGTMGLRLGEKEREAFLSKFKTKLFESYGAIMKEYVSVPDNLLENTSELNKYLKVSFEYVKSLKKKPSTAGSKKKQKAKKKARKKTTKKKSKK